MVIVLLYPILNLLQKPFSRLIIFKMYTQLKRESTWFKPTMESRLFTITNEFFFPNYDLAQLIYATKEVFVFVIKLAISKIHPLDIANQQRHRHINCLNWNNSNTAIQGLSNLLNTEIVTICISRMWCNNIYKT